MRIRKRFHLSSAGEEVDRGRPSDQSNQQIGTWVSSAASGSPKGVQDKDLEQRELERAQQEEDIKSNDRSDENVMGAKTAGTGVILPFSIPAHQVGMWYEGERAFPLKKRRGSFERGSTDEMNMKTKMNKKCDDKGYYDNDHLNEDNETAEGVDGRIKKKAKKRARGNVIMEGSRCSRVNGRGWRCCQPTLVGYSLCEHHLGKSRIRNITTVKSRGIGAMVTKNNIAPPEKNNFLEEKQRETNLIDIGGNEDEEEEKPLKKKTKLGLVKARSLSSLLRETNNEVHQCAKTSEEGKDIMSHVL